MSRREPPPGPSLTVVGTGIRFRDDLTQATRDAIVEAERLLFVTADIMTARWLPELNPRAEHMPSYLEGRPRGETYDLWIRLVLEAVQSGARTTAVAYGHPGVLVHFGHEAIRRARAEGYPARMLPGISAEAWLFADLGVDPGPQGWQSYQASRFLLREPAFDVHTPLMLWQIHVIFHPGKAQGIAREGLRRLQDHLLRFYPPDHEVVIYEASANPATDPVIDPWPLARLARARFRITSSLYVPPLPGTRSPPPR